MSEIVRPTKKQRDILTYIEQFIAEHGYSPSYREIMNGLNYTSVATVSLHVNSLIRRGHLRKRDRSARSLDVVVPTSNQSAGSNSTATNEAKPNAEKWLLAKVDDMFNQFELTSDLPENAFDDMATLINALRVLGMEADASSCMPRLAELRTRIASGAVRDQKEG